MSNNKQWSADPSRRQGERVRGEVLRLLYENHLPATGSEANVRQWPELEAR
jgi:hypothetical protein